MDAQKIPATVITGFLGAGKTTLIRRILATANGKRLALIINEFGDLGIDGEILADCGDKTCQKDEIVELTNGCICCTVAEDFVPTITKLMERDPLPDHIVIETSGLSLPQPLVNAFNWPQIREQLILDGVVTVVDSEAIAEGSFSNNRQKKTEIIDHSSSLEELFKDQIISADLIILNKMDLIGREHVVAVETAVRDATLSPVKFIHAGKDSVPGADVLLGLDIVTNIVHHQDVHEHDHDHFKNLVISGGTVLDIEILKTGLAFIIARHDILRVKGFVAVVGKPMRLVVQAVGQRIDTYFDRNWGLMERQESSLVIIGYSDMDVEKITEGIKGVLGEI
ncbi:cobalamin biosynthesis protein CobW [Candidatus Endowatersipora endosymbiont of Watersipora subatra]|uniref:cobalamin biosynthesis protein CobW n=1 Tax=Candidatus Endowatersipora endosymbiont of Watersipora subatra TaxID=3077946 RepID=UPI00312C9A8B